MNIFIKAGRVTSLAYDLAGANRVTAYEYDANSNVSKITYSNGYTSTFTHDAGNRVTQHKLENTVPATLEQYDYNYSPAGLPSNTFGYTRAETTTGKCTRGFQPRISRAGSPRYITLSTGSTGSSRRR